MQSFDFLSGLRMLATRHQTEGFNHRPIADLLNTRCQLWGWVENWRPNPRGGFFVLLTNCIISPFDFNDRRQINHLWVEADNLDGMTRYDRVGLVGEVHRYFRASDGSYDFGLKPIDVLCFGTLLLKAMDTSRHVKSGFRRLILLRQFLEEVVPALQTKTISLGIDFNYAEFLAFCEDKLEETNRDIKANSKAMVGAVSATRNNITSKPKRRKAFYDL